MPFDSDNKVVYGDDAAQVPTWGRTTLVSFLTARLNDPDGPYYAGLGLSETRSCIVTINATVAGALYKKPPADAPNTQPGPIVFVVEGPAVPQRAGRRIGGTNYRGTLWPLGFTIDSGVSLATSSPVARQQGDLAIGNAVLHCLETNKVALAALGLAALKVKKDDEAQRAGRGRQPLAVSCYALALESYTP